MAREIARFRFTQMKAVNIANLRELACRRLPGIVFDYLDGGSEAEVTMQENRYAFQEVLFRPKQAIASRECNLKTQILGCDLTMPLLLAPIGYLRVMLGNNFKLPIRGIKQLNITEISTGGVDQRF